MRGRSARADSFIGVLSYELRAQMRGAGLFGWKQTLRVGMSRPGPGESDQFCKQLRSIAKVTRWPILQIRTSAEQGSALGNSYALAARRVDGLSPIRAIT